MRTALIGHTGFLGGNLARQFSFDEHFNSTNIAAIRGQHFDLLVSSGVTAMKWWANQNPIEDRARIDSLLGHLDSVQAQRVIVLSTIDVYPVRAGVDETYDCRSLPNHPYGAARLHFEESIRARFANTTAVRISGVFGPGLKKNVIYDLLHDNCLDMINPESVFQYYNVSNLWRDLQHVERVPLINFVSEPIPTSDILRRYFPGKPVPREPIAAANIAAVKYDVRTLYSPTSYLTSAREVMRQLGDFIKTV